MMNIIKSLLSLTAMASLSLSAPADIIHLQVDMNGAKANAGAGTGSPGLGTAALTLDTATNQLSWDITWSGLLSAPGAMHLHGPALPNQNAGLQVGLSVASQPATGNTILNPGQVTDLLAGLWYLNLHTAGFPGGELRGQAFVVNPPPANILHFQANMNGAQANAGAGTGSPGVGLATMTLDTNTNAFTWDITWNGLLSAPGAMHLHGPALPTQNAGVQIGLSVAGQPVVGNSILNPGQVADLKAGLWYLNLHTGGFPGGEVRGQVLSVCPPIVASETVRLGVPANPNVFLPGQTSGPIVGETWDPVVDHTVFTPSATIDMLVIGFSGAINAPLGVNGTLLCDVTLIPPMLLTNPAGTPFSIFIPDDCAFVGLTACTQVASFDAQGFHLTNALDVLIGSF